MTQTEEHQQPSSRDIEQRGLLFQVKYAVWGYVFAR